MSFFSGVMSFRKVILSSDITHITSRKALHSMLSIPLFVIPKEQALIAGSTVIVVRLNKQGELRMARPCDECWDMLDERGVKYVIYSTNYGWERAKING